MGIGNRLAGDDGAGSAVAEALRGRTAACVIDAGIAPENHLEPIVRGEPDTILLVDAANQARRRGLRPGAAIADAVERRFRPLVATTVTTVVGLLPLALSDPFWAPLCVAIIAGLLVSTLISLIVVPALYLLLTPQATAGL